MIKVAFSFDDGRKDTYRAYFEIMKKMDIPMTLNTTLGYIERFIDEKDYPSMNEPLSCDELNNLIADENVEIAAHGYKHNNEADNLLLGIDKLNDILNRNNQYVRGIASPQSKLHYDEIMELKYEFDKRGINYFRTGDRKNEMSFVKRAVRKINRKLNIPLLYYYADAPQFMKNDDEYIYYSNCILKNTSLKELEYTVKRLVNQQQFKGCILNFHSILKPGEPFYDDLYSWDYDKFNKLCEFLCFMKVNGKIDICKTSEF